MTESKPLVRLDAVTVRRGDFLLDVPHWELPAGCVTALVGPNGAGKSTMLELLPGLRGPRSGSVAVFGFDPIKQPVAVRSALGFMSADMPLFKLRIDRLLRTLSGYYPTWDDALVQDLLERFQLDPRKHASKLSLGQGTRLRLITALAFRPRLLVLDEPTAGLDLGGRHQLMEQVLQTVKDEGRSVLISSHQLADVERLADRVTVLRGGRILQDGPTDEVVADTETLEEALLTMGAAG